MNSVSNHDKKYSTVKSFPKSNYQSNTILIGNFVTSPKKSKLEDSLSDPNFNKTNKVSD